MGRYEKVELTTMCMVYRGDTLLLQNRVKPDWAGWTFPGGHVEARESFVQAVKREILEETGLTIEKPRLCGIKQWQTKPDVRYIVLLFKTDCFFRHAYLFSGGRDAVGEAQRAGTLFACKQLYGALQVFDSEEMGEFFYRQGKTAFGNMSCTNCGGAKAPPFYIFPLLVSIVTKYRYLPAQFL